MGRHRYAQVSSWRWNKMHSSKYTPKLIQWK